MEQELEVDTGYDGTWAFEDGDIPITSVSYMKRLQKYDVTEMNNLLARMHIKIEKFNLDLRLAACLAIKYWTENIHSHVLLADAIKTFEAENKARRLYVQIMSTSIKDKYVKQAAKMNRAYYDSLEISLEETYRIRIMEERVIRQEELLVQTTLNLNQLLTQVTIAEKEAVKVYTCDLWHAANHIPL